MELLYNLSDIKIAATQIIDHLKIHKVIAFHGNMGSGKTTLIRATCIQLGVTENISSPTFSIIHEYKGISEPIIYHIDLYRLKDEQEAINAGVEDCVYSGNPCFVEWPGKIAQILPPGVLNVYLERMPDDRRMLRIKVGA